MGGVVEAGAKVGMQTENVYPGQGQKSNLKLHLQGRVDASLGGRSQGNLAKDYVDI